MSDDKDLQARAIDRRSLLVGMGAAAMAFTPLVSAGDSDDHKGHGNHSADKKHDHSRHKPQQAEVLDAVNDCLDKGQRCIAHCLVLFQEGDISVADCAAKVHEMQAICGAFSYLLTANSTHVKATAALCKKVCDECATECRKHDHHHECRECAEACETTIAALQESFG
jgi:Cys-rich four helix bundle protein (predicted Tat secretion target)